MKYMQTLPYSLAEPGPKEVDGVGNCKASCATNRHRRHPQFGFADGLISIQTDAIKLFSQDA
jgi:hypothetical protein